MSKQDQSVAFDKDAIQELLLVALETSGAVADSGEWAESNNLPHTSVVPVIKSLVAREIVSVEQRSARFWVPKKEGLIYLEEGSPEYQVYATVGAAGPDGLPLAELDKQLGKKAKIGMSQCMKSKWVRMEGSGKDKVLYQAMAENEVTDVVRVQLADVRETGGRGSTKLDEPTLVALKKRKLIDSEDRVTYSIAPENLALARAELATDLSAEMLADGSWKTAQFKPYNFNALGLPPPSGHLHPLMKVRDELRVVFLGMGFEEMPTNRFVESSFWNFDALFQPQAHPARDMHDTFFIKDPAETATIPPEYMERVKAMHEKGFEGEGSSERSIGWRYDWQESEARKNLLRTHTTANSSRVLYEVARECMRTGEFRPRRFFSIDRVFRNESLDATHLAEFHQIEGIVVDRGLGLSDLIGTVGEFFKEAFGLTELRFKPAYNPYTEPSMEIFGYMESLGKWVEVGNSGMFRPEMLVPMGMPEGVRCIAWGLSVERPTMMKYNINNIRNLVGHRMPLEDIEGHAICRLNEFH